MVRSVLKQLKIRVKRENIQEEKEEKEAICKSI
jgi:hypothetical protein